MTAWLQTGSAHAHSTADCQITTFDKDNGIVREAAQAARRPGTRDNVSDPS